MWYEQQYSVTGTGLSVLAARLKILNASTCLRQYQQPLPSQERKLLGLDNITQHKKVTNSRLLPVRFLQLVETRLAQLESDVRFLKDQNSQSGNSVRSESIIMADRRGSLASSVYHIAVPVPEQDPEDYGISPDATDGIGSIEFTKEVDSGYYGRHTSITFTTQRNKHVLTIVKFQGLLRILLLRVTSAVLFILFFHVHLPANKLAMRETIAWTSHTGRLSMFRGRPHHIASLREPSRGKQEALRMATTTSACRRTTKWTHLSLGSSWTRGFCFRLSTGRVSWRRITG